MSETYRRIQRPTPPAPTQTLNLVEFRAELRVQIQQALTAEQKTEKVQVEEPGGTIEKDVVVLPPPTLFCPPPGTQKTIITADEVTKLTSGTKVIVFAQNHALAHDEWEKRIPKSLRLMSLSRMGDEGLLTAEVDGKEQKIECPHLEEIKTCQANGLPYFNSYCLQSCKFSGNCSYHRRKKEAKKTAVLVCPHAYLPTISGTGLMDDRIVIIDECAAPYLRSRIEFTETTIGSFRSTLDEFQASGEADGKVLDAIRYVLAEIESVPVGQSKTMNDPGDVLNLDRTFNAKFGRFLSENGGGKNLLPAIKEMAIQRRFVRCSEKDDAKVWWSIRSNLPSYRNPILLLDATGTRELYEEIFPGCQIVVWPESARYAPKSIVTVFSDGAYPQSSLWNTTIDPPKPSDCFHGILGDVEKTIAFHKTEMASVGIVTLMKLTEAVRKRFPAIPKENILHYGDLRGRNSIRTCSLVFIVGCQPPSLLDLAELAVTMFELDCEPASLIGDLKEQRQFEAIDGLDGDFEVQRFAFGNKHMRLAWQALVTAEVAQAVGRSRAHDDRNAVQRVFVFTNIDIGMPATRVMTRKEHLAEMGFAATRANELCLAIKNLASQGKPFTYKQISELSGIELKSLKAPKYQQTIKRTVAELKIAVSGKPAKFETLKEEQK